MAGFLAPRPAPSTACEFISRGPDVRVATRSHLSASAPRLASPLSYVPAAADGAPSATDRRPTSHSATEALSGAALTLVLDLTENSDGAYYAAQWMGVSEYVPRTAVV